MSASEPAAAAPAPAGETVFLDGETLTPDTVLRLGMSPHLTVDLTADAWGRVARARAGMFG